MSATVMPTKEQYQLAYDREMACRYPMIDDLEKAYGYALGRGFLEKTAWLACPVKANPPNWQHGRVIYAVLRKYLASPDAPSPARCIDIGTAKGFSALCAAQALVDAYNSGTVDSIDVIDPKASMRRNSIKDCDGPTTLYELLAPWRGLTYERVYFVRSTGAVFLSEGNERIHFAFIDGKHKYDAVSMELMLLAKRQVKGDIIICDDLQIEGVLRAVVAYGEPLYNFRRVVVIPGKREYAILERK